MAKRSVEELLSADDALPMIREWIAAAPHRVTLLACDQLAGHRALESLQVTTRSPLGALAAHTGGLLVDDGWLRILGAGCENLPRAIDLWNDVEGVPRCDAGLLIGDDVVGGFHAWFREPNTVHYLAPDTLEWEDLGLGYTAWLEWCLSDRFAPFSQDLRWAGWREEVRDLDASMGLMFDPLLCARGEPLVERKRRAVPVAELWTLQTALERELRGLPDGAEFRIDLKR